MAQQDRRQERLLRGRSPVPLERLEKSLLAYSCAAGAAGVGALALAQPVEAKIVYTSANVTLWGKVPLDINHDGTNDFIFNRSSRSNGTYVRTFLSVSADVRSNHIWGTSKGRNSGASDLAAGVRLGPKGKFNLVGGRMASWFAASTSGGKTFAGYYGPWANGGKGAKNRYLGLKFMIKGKVHFGWARVTVKFIGHHAVSGTLTGYAYETIPNKAIITGKKIESDEIDNSAEQPNPGSLSLPTSEPGTLGLLAMGGPGLSIWRREPLGAQP